MFYPPFADLNGELCYPQPFTFEGAKFHYFIFNIPIPQLQAIADKWLNDPAKSRLFPPCFSFDSIAPLLIVSYAHYPAAGLGKDQIGSPVFFNEIAVGFTLFKYTHLGALKLFSGIRTFMPYLFVDNQFSMIAGREIYGLPKAMANFNVRRTDDIVEEVQMQSEVITSAGSYQRGFDVLKLKRIPFLPSGSGGDLEEAWQEYYDLNTFHTAYIDAIRRVNDGIAYDEKFEKEFDLIKMKYVTLKQFRSIQNGQKASFQRIVEFQGGFRKIHFPSRIYQGLYELQINDTTTFPIAKDLGLQNGQKIKGVGIFSKMDFTFDNGTVLQSNA